MAQWVKNMPAMQETQGIRVESLGEMAIRSSILSLENPMDKGAWRATVHRVCHN